MLANRFDSFKKSAMKVIVISVLLFFCIFHITIVIRNWNIYFYQMVGGIYFCSYAYFFKSQTDIRITNKEEM